MANDESNTIEVPEENQEFDTSPVPETNNPPPFIPVPQWNKYYPWPPSGGMRHLIFHAETNGFGPAFFRVGRNVIVDVGRFWSIARKRRGAK